MLSVGPWYRLIQLRSSSACSSHRNWIISSLGGIALSRFGIIQCQIANVRFQGFGLETCLGLLLPVEKAWADYFREPD
jgi:hypothetical protein